jgi:hypothetical protein
MKGETGERWRVLCSKAAEEQDPNRLMQLITEINRLLEDKEQRLLHIRPSQQPTQSSAS